MSPSRIDSLVCQPRWTRGEAQEVLDALECSGESVRVFATDHGLDPQRLYAWRRRLGGAEPTTFQEILVRPTEIRLDVAPFEIALASGDVVRVPPSFNAEGLARLLNVLSRPRAC
jgi:transposase-like protein